MKQKLKKRMVSALFSLFLPSKCPVCGKLLSDSEVYVCENCLRESFYYEKCPFCHFPLPLEGKCLFCGRDREIDSENIFFLGPYRGALREAIKAMKFEGYSKIGRIIGKEFSKVIKLPQERSVFIPVPLSRKNFRKRGFNQSAVIARSAAEVLNQDFIDEALQVKGKKKNQMELNHEERIENIRGKMSEGKNFNLIKGRNIIIFDDVMTTGETLREAKRVLRKTETKGLFCAVAAIVVD
ncbi:ComF family protein [candidate division WOR-3 bacterium]|nr:ComF family protein [candidate division WOR-3 bacterium]